MHTQKRYIRIFGCSVLMLLGICMVTPLKTFAVEQRFGLSDEAYTMAKGSWEFDSSLQLEHDAENDGYAFSHDLFYGVSENVELQITLSRWSIVSGGEETADGAGTETAGGEGDGEGQTSWDSAGVGVGYTLFNPQKEKFGMALFANMQIGDKLFALNGTAALQKNFSNITVLYNGVIETEWTGDQLSNLNNDAEEITQSLGGSIALGKGFHLGIETLYEVSMINWSNSEAAFFAGPNLNFQNGKFFITVAPLLQVTNNSEYEDLQLGLRAGILF
ncbi:conserved hypothetical secreted protein [Candidatus Moduliflexus flocculans]|uniref:Conserved hypothetical secreted protein n=1 Tax=Candidatus Moduliflexus flocculans TaxID=1499966 RepID=A0A0S6VZM0_9BACT|nr:conserved hypothetical secreted protein [Candidatus Moduliflexus flocculans]